MKSILTRMSDGGVDMAVDQYLFIFLKFIQSVVPTIECVAESAFARRRQPHASYVPHKTLMPHFPGFCQA